jgi:Zn-dependent membrane protease YugP
VQHAKGYVPIKIRTALVPVCNLGATLSFPLLILGVVMNAFALVNIGLILFATATVFQLVTLPVEFNASRRAMAFIKTSNLFSRDEISGARKVLTAAAFTYVAALAQSVLQLLYYVMRFSGNRRR